MSKKSKYQISDNSSDSNNTTPRQNSDDQNFNNQYDIAAIRNSENSNNITPPLTEDIYNDSDDDILDTYLSTFRVKIPTKDTQQIKHTLENFNKILKQYYGYDSLKDLQYKIIKSVIDGNDVIALLPTSYGKSICYQMPYLITNKNVIIISPLISLMEDQMRELKTKGIPTICLSSNNKNKQNGITDIYSGKPKIIYTTPEYLAKNPSFVEILADNDALALIAIDECHCISAWGHSFRSEYQRLNCLKTIAPQIPILALTATATEKVLTDVRKNLHMDNPLIIKHSVDRKNLYIEIHPKDDAVLTAKIIPIINKYPSEKVLIYCKTVHDTDGVCKKINDLGYKCESYHAKKDTNVRSQIQKNFTNKDSGCNVIVATIAFGMGINIPNIRALIHYNCSNDIESYMQEIGRAGRDGNMSDCYLFYSQKDFALNYSFLKEIPNPVIRKQKEEDVNYLKKYVTTTECRRKVLLQYFNEIMTEPCNNCDNCLNGRHNRDFAREAYLLFGTINSLDYRYGTTTYIKLLLGSKDKTISKHIDSAICFYGKGKQHNEDWWKKFIGLAISNQYITEEKIQGKAYFNCVIVLKLSAKGMTWYNKYRGMLEMSGGTEESDISSEKRRQLPTLVISVTPDFKQIDKTLSQQKLEKTEAKFDNAEFKDKFGDQVARVMQKKKVTVTKKQVPAPDADTDGNDTPAKKIKAKKDITVAFKKIQRPALPTSSDSDTAEPIAKPIAKPTAKPIASKVPIIASKVPTTASKVPTTASKVPIIASKVPITTKTIASKLPIKITKKPVSESDSDSDTDSDSDSNSN